MAQAKRSRMEEEEEEEEEEQPATVSPTKQSEDKTPALPTPTKLLDLPNRLHAALGGHGSGQGREEIETLKIQLAEANMKFESWRQNSLNLMKVAQSFWKDQRLTFEEAKTLLESFIPPN